MFAREKNQKKKYPYLGKFPNGEIVFFVEKEAGYSMGGLDGSYWEYSNCWDEGGAEIFDGILEISNKDFRSSK